MSDAGIFSLSSLLVGMVSAVGTGPFGGIALPEGDFEAMVSERPSGYHAQVTLSDGTPAGLLQSTQPVPVELDKLPATFIDAVLSIEDRRFAEHAGLDPFALGRAAQETLTGDVRGGSTVTQQMIKNTALGNAITMERKILEAILAVRAHTAMSRERILETYLESAWFGRGQTGVMRAPQVWFEKEWDALTLGETAFLAAILKGPHAYDPIRNRDRALARRDLVIDAMRETGSITAEQAEAAKAETLEVVPRTQAQGGDPWVRSLARAQMSRDGIAERIGRISDQLVVETTVDPGWQAIAAGALRDGLDGFAPLAPLGTLPQRTLDAFADADDGIGAADRATLASAIRGNGRAVAPVGRVALLRRGDGGWIGAHLDADGALSVTDVAIVEDRFRPSPGDILVVREAGDGAVRAAAVPEFQGAVYIMDPRDGRVLASIGGYDGRLTSFDRTRQARRQPGSAIKGFLYAAALDAGYRFDDMVDNHERTYFDANGLPWRPRNYDRSQSGPIPLFVGFERSSNLAAASIVSAMGVSRLADFAERAGVYEDGEMGRFLASSLGTSETTLERLTAGYGTLINEGIPRRPYGLGVVRNPADGARADLWSFAQDRDQPGSPISMRSTPDVVTSMMRGVVTRGTAAQAFSGHPVTVVGKTGTSQNHADAWFMALTPHLAVGIWIGRDDNRPMGDGFTGGRTAARVTADLLQRAHAQGLISAEGFRDPERNPNILWPPATLAPGQGPAQGQFGYDPERDYLGSQLPSHGGPGSTSTGSPGAGASSSQQERPSGAFVGSGGLY